MSTNNGLYNVLSCWKQSWSWFYLKKNGSPTFMGKLLYQAPIFGIGDSGASVRCPQQYSTATMNKCHWENDILWCWMGCSMLEGGIHKVIRGQGIPVNAVIKVHNGKSSLIWRYCRTASVPRWDKRRPVAEAVKRTFYMSVGGCANWFWESSDSMHYWWLVKHILSDLLWTNLHYAMVQVCYQKDVIIGS